MNGKINTEIVFCNSFELLTDKIKSLYNGTVKENTKNKKNPLKKIKELYKNGISIELEADDERKNINSSKLPLVKICIVTDEKVEEKYMNKVKYELNKIDSTVFDFILMSGDASKNIENAIKLYQKLTKYNFSRNDLVIGLGGGVVGDFAGFVSSTFKRGTKLLYIPTTVLSQADSCIGGKTAVNFYQNKNMIGTFYPADVVYVNSDTLLSLSNRHFFNGFAEIIKTGYILEPKLLLFLRENQEALLMRNGDIILELIEWCNRLKFDVISKDPYDEMGEREILNFGHTLAHAIEAESNYEILHGEAVAIGLLYALFIGMRQGKLSNNDIQQGYELIRSFHLFEYSMEYLDKNPAFDELIPHILNDKKNDQYGIGFVLLDKIGQASKEYITDRFLLEEVWEQMKDFLMNNRYNNK